tara:strand:+ start:1260 stop:1721 length:462 start_codon:yes stop_codon:yes gene_type:complete
MTARGDIFDAVYTALGGISTSDPTPYNFTVAKVEKVVRDWNDSETFPRPWIGFRPGNETYEYNPSHIIRCTMELNIVAHTSPLNGTVNNHYSDTEKMTVDILRALRQDVIRASCAESISLQQTQTSEGDPSAIDTASLAMLFNVIYYRTEPTT